MDPSSYDENGGNSESNGYAYTTSCLVKGNKKYYMMSTTV